MEFKNTIQSLQKLGNDVVREGRNILKQKQKNATGALSRDFDYLVTNQRDSVTLEFEFGRAEDYWQFVDEGVRGAGGYEGNARLLFVINLPFASLPFKLLDFIHFIRGCLGGILLEYLNGLPCPLARPEPLKPPAPLTPSSTNCQ